MCSGHHFFVCFTASKADALWCPRRCDRFQSGGGRAHEARLERLFLAYNSLFHGRFYGLLPLPSEEVSTVEAALAILPPLRRSQPRPPDPAHARWRAW